MRDETLGELLSRLRSQKGCGLRWASQGIGVTPSELSKFERGYANPSPETLQAIATFYGTDVDTLAALVVEPPPMLGKMGIHIAGASDMSDETVAALLALGKHVSYTSEELDQLPDESDRAAVAMTDAEIEAAAASDPDCTPTALVAAFQALPDDYAESRERAISSLRWGCDERDWLACAAQANALGVTEL